MTLSLSGAPRPCGVPEAYAARLTQAIAEQNWSSVHALIDLIREADKAEANVFVCGNGGSAANAIHWANDFIYPVAKARGRGLRMVALTANTAVLSCLANDIDYASVFSQQLRVFGRPGDVLIVLSGSGNSANIISAVNAARELGMRTAGVFGFSGGECLPLVDVGVHFSVHDMQIAEDLQLVVNHMVMRALSEAAHD